MFEPDVVIEKENEEMSGSLVIGKNPIGNFSKDLINFKDETNNNGSLISKNNMANIDLNVNNNLHRTVSNKKDGNNKFVVEQFLDKYNNNTTNVNKSYIQENNDDEIKIKGVDRVDKFEKFEKNDKFENNPNVNEVVRLIPNQVDSRNSFSEESSDESDTRTERINANQNNDEEVKKILNSK
jgi:hypothetical protein